jgi:hypothetical protein
VPPRERSTPPIPLEIEWRPLLQLQQAQPSQFCEHRPGIELDRIAHRLGPQLPNINGHGESICASPPILRSSHASQD